MKSSLKQKSGITLIALVITIVVLLILAGVTIATLTGENGIIAKANQAKEDNIIAGYKEKLKLKFSELNMQRAIEGKTGQLTDEEKNNFINELKKEDWIASIEENEGKIEIITKDNYKIVFSISEKGQIIIEEAGKNTGDPFPEITATIIPLTGESGEKIKVKVVATVRKGKVEKIQASNGETTDYVEEGVIFELDTNGEYTFTAITDKGKQKSTTLDVNVSIVESSISMHANPTTARNTESVGTKNGIETGPVVVTIQYEESELKKQYKKETDEGWTTVTENTVSVEVTSNIAVLARYYDDTNAYKLTTYNVQNVDNEKPVFVSKDSNVDGATITVTANAEDTASEDAAADIAGILRYEYSKDGNTYQSSNTFSNCTVGEYTIYVKAIDKAGNECIDTIAVTISNTGPTIESVSISSKTSSSLTISALARDNEGDALTYKLYMAQVTGSTPTYSLKATSEAIASGTAATLQATGLSNYTDYNYYVEVSDGQVETTCETQVGKTQCSGRTSYCSSAYTCNSGSRSYCNNYSQCSGGTSVRCVGGNSITRATEGCLSCGELADIGATVCEKCGGTVGQICTVCNKPLENCPKHPCEHGEMEAHTVTTNCSHGYSSAHVVPCSHGYTTAHYYNIVKCSHGYSYTHAVVCSHSCARSHYYCAHSNSGTAHN